MFRHHLRLAPSAQLRTGLLRVLVVTTCVVVGGLLFAGTAYGQGVDGSDPCDPVTQDGAGELVKGWQQVRDIVTRAIDSDNQRWYDGFFFGANPDYDPEDAENTKYWVLNQRIDFNNTEYIPFARDYAVQPSEKISDELILYVNGINTTFVTHHNTLQMVADATGHPVLGILNASQDKSRLGVGGDVIQTALDRGYALADGEELGVTPPLNSATATLKYALIHNVMENYDRQLRGEPRVAIRVMSHSQGGAISNRAMGEAANVLKVMQAKVLEDNPDLTAADVPLDLRDIRYTGFGNAAGGNVASNVWPDGPGLGEDALGWYEHYVHVKDPTPIYLGLSNKLRDDEERAGAGARVIRFQGEPKSGQYWDRIVAASQVLLEKSKCARELWDDNKHVSAAVVAESCDVGLDTATQLVSVFEQDPQTELSADEGIELVRYEHLDLVRAHIGDSNFYEEKPGKDWFANRTDRATDGAKFTEYHHVMLSYLKYWVQRNGVRGVNRPEDNDRPIWVNREVLAWLENAEFEGTWSGTEGTSDFSLPVQGSNRSSGRFQVRLPEHLLTEADIAANQKPDTWFKGWLIEFDWGTVFDAPRMNMTETDTGWTGTWTGANSRITMDLDKSGDMQLKVHDLILRQGKLETGSVRTQFDGKMKMILPEGGVL